MFKGTDTIATIVISRAAVGATEALHWPEYVCGAFQLLGMLLIAQPGFIFGRTHVTMEGLAVAVVSGLGSGVFNVFTRVLSRKGGPHDGILPPPMLLSFFMVVVFLYVLLLALIARAVGLDVKSGWEWIALKMPSAPADWLLLVLYCAGILTGQLAMAAGYATTRAGLAAFLALAELGFAYLLGGTREAEPKHVLQLFARRLSGSVALLAVRQKGRRPDAKPLAVRTAPDARPTRPQSVELPDSEKQRDARDRCSRQRWQRHHTKAAMRCISRTDVRSV